MGGISSTPSWATLSGKPSTVSGYNITDFSSNVATSTAGVSAGAIGSYANMYQAGSGDAATGATKAGSQLNYSTQQAQTGGIPSGTWRCMGISYQGSTSLWLRIS